MRFVVPAKPGGVFVLAGEKLKGTQTNCNFNSVIRLSHICVCGMFGCVWDATHRNIRWYALISSHLIWHHHGWPAVDPVVIPESLDKSTKQVLKWVYWPLTWEAFLKVTNHENDENYFFNKFDVVPFKEQNFFFTHLFSYFCSFEILQKSALEYKKVDMYCSDLTNEMWI